MIQHVVRIGIARRDGDANVAVRIEAVHNRDSFPVLRVDLPRDVLHLHLRLPVGGNVKLRRLAAHHLLI